MAQSHSQPLQYGLECAKRFDEAPQVGTFRVACQEPPEPSPPDDGIYRLENAYAVTLERPDGSVLQLGDIIDVDATREHTALSDWSIALPANRELESWLHSAMTLTYDGRIIYRGTLEEIETARSDLAAILSGPGAGAGLETGSTEFTIASTEDWRAITLAWETLTDFDAHVVRPTNPRPIDEFTAEGSPLDILQELHEDYGFRFTVSQTEPKTVSSYKPGAISRQAVWETIDEERNRSVQGYANAVTVTGAQKENSSERFAAEAQDETEIARLSQQGISEPIWYHETDRSLESQQDCQARAEALLEDLVTQDEVTGVIDTFPRLLNPGTNYTVPEWDDERRVGAYSLEFDGSSSGYVTLPAEPLEQLEAGDAGALLFWVRVDRAAPSPLALASDQALEVSVSGDEMTLSASVGAAALTTSLEVERDVIDPTAEDWRLCHIDWEYDAQADELTLRGGAHGELVSDVTRGEPNLVSSEWWLGRDGAGNTASDGALLDDVWLVDRPLSAETYRALSRREITMPYSVEVVSRYPLNATLAEITTTIWDTYGGYHGERAQALGFAGEPKTLESVDYTESAGQATGSLNFRRIPSLAARIEALRRTQTKLAKRL